MKPILAQSITKEFSVDEKTGKGAVSRKGVARLSGVSYQAITQLLATIEGGAPENIARQNLKGGKQKLGKTLQPFAGQGFKGGNLPDTLATAIIQHYAIKGKEKAIESLMLISAIGLRTTIQKSLNWRATKPDISIDDIIEMCCLPAPTTWQRRFPKEYYDQLSRLTGLKVEGNERPMRFAQLTKELVYDFLPDGIYSEVKRCKKETGSLEKLHQFLSEEGVAILEAHQRRLLPIMQSAASLESLKIALNNAITGNYQLILLPMGA